MRGEDLFVAVGHMDEEFLADSRIVEEKKPKRILWRTILVAAIIASLVISAAAAIVYFVSGEVLWERVRYTETINGKTVVFLEEELSVYIDWDVPNPRLYLEQILIPGGMTTDNTMGTHTGTTLDENGEKQYTQVITLWFQEDLIPGKRVELELMQRDSYGYDPEEQIDWLQIPGDATEVTSETVLLGEQEYFLVRLDSEYEDKYFIYWTDGTYFFRLMFPEELDLEQVQDIAESLRAVDSLQPYNDAWNARFEQEQGKWLERFSERFNSHEPYEFRASVENGRLKETESGRVLVAVDFLLNDDAPETIQRIVYPQVYRDRAECWGYEFRGNPYEHLGYVILMWEMQEYGENVWMTFYQYGGGYTGLFEELGFISTVSDASSVDAVEERMLSWDENTLYEVSYAKTQRGEPGYRMLYWTDGNYIYQLNCPYAMDDATIQTVIESMDGA